MTPINYASVLNVRACTPILKSAAVISYWLQSFLFCCPLLRIGTILVLTLKLIRRSEKFPQQFERRTKLQQKLNIKKYCVSE